MPSILRSGDIAFARLAADAPDGFCFVALVALEAGTAIHFTDNAWNADGTLRAGEGTVTWTAGAAVAAGTVVVLSGVDGEAPGASTGSAAPAGAGAFNLATAGDAVIAYQGAVGAPARVLAAVSTTAFLTAGATGSNTSYLPGTGTATADDDVAVGESALVLSPAAVDSGVYSAAVVSGTAAELRAALNAGSNWTTGEDAVADAPGFFAVTDGGAPVGEPAVIELPVTGPPATVVVVAPSAPEPPAGDGALPIGQVQGAGHASPLAGQRVTVRGVVTAVDSNGFYLQDGGDGDVATSDGVLVFTGARPTVTAGQSVAVSGVVGEFRPGNAAGNLTTTQIGGPVVTTLDAALPAVAATALGAGGRAAPTAVAQDDAFTSFDVAADGVDFYESLEGMLLRVPDAVVAQGTNGFGESWVLADGGAGATGRTPRGGVILTEADRNPEKVQVQYDAAAGNVLPGFSPALTVGDRLGDVEGVLSYNFGQYELLPTRAFAATDGELRPEVTALRAGPVTLTVADYNVENLDPGDGAARFDALAADIVGNLGTPDILALQEIQDNNGAVNDAVTDASLTGRALIDAVLRAGGPRYAYADIAPVDDTSGGEPGGNIRPGFLYRDDRVELLSLGQVAPGDAAFANSRVPLAGSFGFNGEIVTLINVHYASKGGSSTDFGALFPPLNGGEAARLAQARVTNAYVDAVLAERPGAKLLVIGDHNEFFFENPQAVLRGEDDGSRVLADLNTGLPMSERYTYTFDGNSQDLDHTLATDAAFGVATYDAVHINSEFSDEAGALSGRTRNSDHDPQVTALAIAPNAAIDFTFTRLGVFGPFNLVYQDEARPGEQSSDAPDDDTLGTLSRFSRINGGVAITAAEFRASSPVFTPTILINNPATLDWTSDTAATLRSGVPNDAFGLDLTVREFTGTALALEGWRVVDVGLAGAGPLSLDVQGAGGGAIALGEGDDALRIGSDVPAAGRFFFDIRTGAGDDAVSFVAENRDYTPGRADPGGLRAEADLGAGDDTYLGSEGEDRVAGGAGDDVLRGMGGADALSGGGGADRLFGENGDDALDGGAGNDVLEGGLGRDVTVGGAGDDIHVVEGSDDQVIENAGEGYDTVIVTGSFYALPFGGPEIEVILGTDADQTLFGAGGNELIAGGGGNDTLRGAEGSDTLVGGAGRDTFLFASSEGEDPDVVADFTPGEDAVLLSNMGSVFFVQRSFADVLSVATQEGDDVVLALTTTFRNLPGVTASLPVTLEGVALAQLSAGDILFG